MLITDLNLLKHQPAKYTASTHYDLPKSNKTGFFRLLGEKLMQGMLHMKPSLNRQSQDA